MRSHKVISLAGVNALSYAHRVTTIQTVLNSLIHSQILKIILCLLLLVLPDYQYTMSVEKLSQQFTSRKSLKQVIKGGPYSLLTLV